MKILNDNTFHERIITISIDTKEFNTILIKAACEFVNVIDGKLDLVINEATEGSPPYKIGYKAIVTITQNLEIK